jgi:glycosyltransferase involved in cell wall biosynthesis
MSRLASLRVGYVPYSHSLTKPGDRRRFVHYARSRGIEFEIARPDGKYDIVVVAENADITYWSQYDRGTRVVFDFIDSYLAIPRHDLKGRLRGLAKYAAGQHRHLRLDHWRALEAMCERADAVICATLEQAAMIAPFCSNVHPILDVHSSVVRGGKSDYRSGPVFNLVWEGLPENAASLQALRGVFQRLQRDRAIALHVVTDLEFKPRLGAYGRMQTADLVRDLCDRVYLYQWNDQMAGAIMCASDLAIIPIDLHDPMAAGKPENKLVLFWRMGVPVLTSATPAYQRAMERAGTSGTCRSEGDWLEALERYASDAELRANAGRAGKALAESEYSEQVILDQWDRLFDTLL